MESDSRNQARKAYYKDRVENLRQQVPMVNVLDHLGIRVHVTQDVEIQYPCPLHGDGKDQGFSARVYPEEAGDPGGHTFCWGCQKSRDQIQWVRDYKGMSFVGAIKYLEDTFGVDNVPSIYDYFDPNFVPEGVAEEPKNKLVSEIETALQGGGESQKVQTAGNPFPPTFWPEIERKIIRLRSSDKLSPEGATKLFFVLDSLEYDVKEGLCSSEEVALKRGHQIYQKIQELET